MINCLFYDSHFLYLWNKYGNFSLITILRLPRSKTLNIHLDKYIRKLFFRGKFILVHKTPPKKHHTFPRRTCRVFVDKIWKWHKICRIHVYKIIGNYTRMKPHILNVHNKKAIYMKRSLP
jgi:hypothetical protein